MPFLLCTTIGWSADFNVDGINYQILSDETVMVVAKEESSDNSGLGLSFSKGYEGEIVIPEHVSHDGQDYVVTAFDTYVFYESVWLTSITIPSTVVDMGPTPFGACNQLETINVSNDNPVYSSVDGVLMDKSRRTLIACPGGKEGRYDVPEGVTSIANSAFYGCTSLTSVYLPSSVISVGSSAFKGCTHLVEVDLGDRIQSISNHTFNGCRMLETLVIPSSVSSIGNGAFFKCENLKTINLPSNVESIGANAFANCTKIETLEVHRITPPLLTSEAFTTTTYNNALLYVSEIAIDDYLSADYWKKFKNVNTLPWEWPNGMLRGDINRDGTVSVSDVTLLVYYILSNEKTTYWRLGDMNEDDTISVSDVMGIVEIILDN